MNKSMAYVKTVKGGIKSAEHLYCAINYILDKDKSSVSSFYNCQQGDTVDITQQFQITRLLWNKDNKIISHHLVQSFSPEDNITPQQANEIGLELIQKIAPGYQVVISTHIDKGHIHNHFIINSVNPITGNKFLDNESMLNFARSESDKICKSHNISVIDNTLSKYDGIDQTTYQLGIKGKSWKIQLVKDLDDALAVCKSKDEFIKFMESRDYSVKYKDIHITFQKNGEKKGIRAKRLSAQFGEKYSKQNIDRILGVTPSAEIQSTLPILPVEQPSEKRKRKKTSYKNEYERLEENYFKQNPPMTFNSSESWLMSGVLFRQNPLKFTLNVIRHLFLKKKKYPPKKYRTHHFSKQTVSPVSKKEIFSCKGNISYEMLKSAPGKTAQIKIYAWQLPKLLSQNFFYHSFIDIRKGIATVYLKEKDLTKFAKALELNDEMFFVKQNEQITNRKIYNELKRNNEKVSYLVVTKEQLELLKDSGITFAYFEKEDKFNIVFSPDDKDNVIKLLNPEQYSKQQKQRINRKIYDELKQENTTLNYFLITAEQLELLKDKGIKFAYFEKEDKYNIAFSPESKQQIVQLLYPHQNQKESTYQRNGRINAELKEEASQTGDKLHYRIVSSKQLHYLEKSGIKFAYFRKEEKNNIVFLGKDKDTVENILLMYRQEQESTDNKPKHKK